jgi:hypothetical protein
VPVAHPELRHQPDCSGDKMPAADHRRYEGCGEWRQAAAERGRYRSLGGFGPERQVRHRQYLAGHWPALLVVRVEQATVAWPEHRERELPAEVGRILDAAVHSLPGGGGVGMGGISGEIEASAAEPVGHAALQPDP